ncbi:MAG: rRNA maturation RNase YbeY [Hyphomicrobiales bacterium]|nr:rRNA maturation RNase YbeY [Hyphomicrobiales bacterium]
MTIEIDIAVESESWDAIELETLVNSAVEAARAESRVVLAPVAEISLLFCDDARIRELNREWRRIDKATNVLSFPAADPARLSQAPLLGDIAIAFETVERESVDERKAFPDHLSHMVVHGFLHLVGFDHEIESDAEAMEAAERRALARLGIADPYAETEPVRSAQS